MRLGNINIDQDEEQEEPLEIHQRQDAPEEEKKHYLVAGRHDKHYSPKNASANYKMSDYSSCKESIKPLSFIVEQSDEDDEQEVQSAQIGQNND